jgi:hypothetical protein
MIVMDCKVEVPMRKGGLLFKEALVEDPLEEMMAGMVMAQYGITGHHLF